MSDLWPGSRKQDPQHGELVLRHNTGSKTFTEPAWFWEAQDGTQVKCTPAEIQQLYEH